MIVFFFAMLLGFVAGLRSLLAPTLVAWACHLGLLDLSGTWLDFLNADWLRWVLSVLALVELITDQLPSTPSRTVPIQFGTRLLTGAVSGAAIGIQGNSMWAGLVAGILGAIVGTLGGHAVRAELASAFGKDRPAAIIEDVMAIGGALLVGVALS